MTEFDQTFTTSGLRDKDERFKFWGQKVKVTVGSNVPQNALFGLAVVTCWRRHNSRWSRNQHQGSRCYPFKTSLHDAFITRKQSETADFRQRHVVRQVTAPYSVWQRFPLCPIESNVNENFRVIQNPGFLPDHSQN